MYEYSVKYAKRIDAPYAKVITTIYNSAAQVPGQPGTDIHLDDYQRMVLTPKEAMDTKACSISCKPTFI